MPPPNHRISPAGLFGAPDPPPSQCSLTPLPSRCPQAVLLALPTPSHKDKIETAAGARIAGSPHFAGQQPSRAFPDPFEQQQQWAPNPLHASVLSAWELLCCQVQEELFCAHELLLAVDKLSMQRA
ncbi:uncharacterized protein [Triticum aestivum]|uniref:uncharacterized protein isoform X1 n=1 Tax=Triticum aestivum TaxID=4565 RepID=UPI001D01E76C|nr:uncharacterized protein LOC123045796 isoform X1 [Triticum aestivum]